MRGVEVETRSGWRSVAPTQTSWFVPACSSQGCRVRYRFDLAGASSQASIDRVLRHGDAFLTMPAAWLLRPLFARGQAPVSLHVTTPPGVSFVTGLPSPSDPLHGPYLANVEDIPQPPYTGIGRFRTQHVEAPGGAVQVATVPSLPVDDGLLRDWISKNIRLLTEQHGRLPLSHLLVMLAPAEGAGIDGGVTMGNGGATVVLWVGDQTEKRHLDDDWILLHELLHVAFPGLPPEQHWIEEGLATYLEPLMRARAGKVSEQDAWNKLCEGFRGLKLAGPLDGTTDERHVYWGGALFFLQVDTDLREQAAGSLDDALRTLVRRGGTVDHRWPIEQLLASLDAPARAVFSRRYQEFGKSAAPLDPAPPLARLGVRCDEDAARLDETAPLAGVRRAMTAGAR